jgi:hypothetical protein
MRVGLREFEPYDWVVVCAVRYEPVSTPNYLLSGLLQGIFANCCLLSENAPGLAALIQWLTSEFPKGRNRPFLVFIRGRFSKNRGRSAPNRRLTPLLQMLKKIAMSALFPVYSLDEWS